MENNNGFIKLNRTALELLESDPDVFLLISQIALRAKWRITVFDNKKTEIGQALIGDFKKIGLTRQRYRSAIWRAEFKYIIVTTQGTNKGTIVTILDTTIYDINTQDKNQQNNQQITTKEERKKVKEKYIKEKSAEASSPPTPSKISEEQLAAIAKQFPALDVKEKFEEMMDYCGATGKKYKDLAAALRNWCRRDMQKPSQTGVYSKSDCSEKNREVACKLEAWFSKLSIKRKNGCGIIVGQNYIEFNSGNIVKQIYFKDTENAFKIQYESILKQWKL